MPPALFALLLAISDPTAATSAQADADLAERVPAGAPKDDYAFVAWCDGVLSGHMDLAERIKDVLPVDPVQQKIGRAYLAAYERALADSTEGSTETGKKRAQAARETGWKNWEKARKADKQLAEDTYLAWQLPGRCEHAAIRLSGDKDLFRMSPSTAEVEAMGEQAPVSNAQAGQTQAADELGSSAGAGAPPAEVADELKIKTIPDDPAASKPDPADEAKKKKADMEDRAWHSDEAPH